MKGLNLESTLGCGFHFRLPEAKVNNAKVKGLFPLMSPAGMWHYHNSLWLSCQCAPFSGYDTGHFCCQEERRIPAGSRKKNFNINIQEGILQTVLEETQNPAKAYQKRGLVFASLEGHRVRLLSASHPFIIHSCNMLESSLRQGAGAWGCRGG